MPVRLTSSFLFGLSGVFFFLEGSQVAQALLHGAAPQGAVVVGLPVDPVQALDMSILLPGLTLTGLQLRRHRPLGYFMAAPLLVHMTILGIAVVSMFFIMMLRGLPAPYPAMALFGASTLFSLLVATNFLRALRR